MQKGLPAHVSLLPLRRLRRGLYESIEQRVGPVGTGTAAGVR